MEYIKTPAESLEIETEVSEMKNVLDGTDGRLDIAEENSDGFEYITKETVQKWKWDFKNLRKLKRASVSCGCTFKKYNMPAIGIPKGKGEGQKNI